MRMIDAPVDDSRHSFAKIAIPYTILSLAQFTTQKTSHKLQSAPIHISMNQGAFYILTDEVLTKSLF